MIKLCIAAAAAVASVVSDSVRPHRWQPTRLPRPWDSPGKVHSKYRMNPERKHLKFQSEIKITSTLRGGQTPERQDYLSNFTGETSSW